MAADRIAAPHPRISRPRGPLGAFGAWLGERGRAVNVANVERFCKYIFLIFWVIVTITVVFDAYSFYVARREIDSELRAIKDKTPPSLEYLGILSQRKRALAITTLEGRCMERTQLTLFRIFDAQQDKIKSVYQDMIKINAQMVRIVSAP